MPVHLFHRDAFQEVFLAAWRHLPDGAIAHLTSGADLDARTVAELWFRRCMAPERVLFYEDLDDIPFAAIDRRQRAFLAMASTNIRIASRPRRFETAALDRLRAGGANIPEVTLASLTACQDAFVAGCARIRRFCEEHRHRFGRSAEIVEVEPAAFATPLREASGR